jgi:hypothetical protein
MTWGKTFEVGGEFGEGLAGAVDDVEEEERGEEAVAGGAAAGEDDVAGLLAAEGAPVASICSRTYLSPTGARSMAMPLRLRAASRPMLDMVVATTVLLVRRPRACRSRAASRRTASPLTTLPCSSAKRARSASPSKVMPMEAFWATTSLAATMSGWRAPQCSLMLRPLGLAWVM